MSQATAAIANMSRTLFRAAVNAITQAIQSLNSGATAPSEVYAYMPWADTTSGWAKTLNAASSAWIKRYPLGTGAWVDVASAATLDLDANAASSDKLRITGTTATTAITLAEGQKRLLRAAGAWPITHGASLICPGSASYTCAAGDLIMAIGEAGSVVRLMIWKADGTAVVGSGLTLGTAQVTTSGTSKDYAIASGVKRITVMLNAVSTNGTSMPMLRLGDSGGVESTSYVAIGIGTSSGALSTADFTDGFPVGGDAHTASRSISGVFTLCLMGSHTWTIEGTARRESAQSASVAGAKTLTTEITTLRLTTSGGTDAFDAGEWNITTE